MKKSQEKSYRLFFALWPIERVRSSINDTFLKCPQPVGRVMDSRNLHVTLHFLGQVTESTKDCMHAAARSVAAEAFQLNMDKFGHFPKSKIFWMGAQNLPVQLTQLHKKLGVAIEGCGFNLETRPYSPHVTLLRKCSESIPAHVNFSIPWLVEEFVLVESITSERGVNYQVIEKYPLA